MLLSAEKATDQILCVWFVSVYKHFWLCRSQILLVWSQLPLPTNFPSGEIATLLMRCVCPSMRKFLRDSRSSSRTELSSAPHATHFPSDEIATPTSIPAPMSMGSALIFAAT